MLVLALFNWWYSTGWRDRAQLVAERLERTLDYFSINLLIKTLFMPFRQISAGKAAGVSLDAKFRAFVDRLISRLIGAMIRSVVLLIGLVTIAVQTIFGLLVLIGWAVLPLLPIIGLSMFLIGWTPV